MLIVDMIRKYFAPLLCNKETCIANALSCKGWTTRTKLSLLYDLVQATCSIPGDLLEVGSAWGRSTVLLGLSTSKTIWSIDPHTGGVAYIRRGENQDSCAEFYKNLRKFGVTNKVKSLINTTEEVVNLNLIPKDVAFSFVFIDGLHTANGVSTDFDFAFHRLSEGGVMVFDDYFEPSVVDYAEMIDTLCKKNSIELIKDKESRLVYFKKLSVPPLIERDQNSRYLLLDSGFHGDTYLQHFFDYIAKNSSYFIETGTNVGSTLRYVARNYPSLSLLSCEPDKKAYLLAKQNTTSCKVDLYNEDSVTFFLHFLNRYPDIFNHNVTFWLDAHGTGFEWPLLHEVAFITKHFERTNIFIDDFKIPGREWFGFDSYDGQECSLEYISDSLSKNHSYTLYYPKYTEKTSSFHPLRGWCLIRYGYGLESILTDETEKWIESLEFSRKQ